jgi:transcriptional regulator with XRE-family HTH domain
MMMSTMTMTSHTMRPVGELLREWRERRRLSQMALALDAEISTRHLSFMETGRALPSREMVLRIAEHLAVPLRARNNLLLAAGYAPAYPERGLDDPALQAAREVVDRVLAGHEPFPAIAVDREWSLVAANRAVAPLMSGVAPELLQPPLNVLRLSLHPDGMAPRIANLRQWREHIFERLEQQIERSADQQLVALQEELRGYPDTFSDLVRGGGGQEQRFPGLTGVAIPLQLRAGEDVLNLISTTMVFGTPVDVTLSELAIEAFFPADAATAEALTRLSREFVT